MRRMLSSTVSALALLALLAGAPAGAQWPPEIKNLQVLPEDTDVQALIGMMRGFTNALGVRCQHCHVGEEGQRLSEFDFASDDRAAKKKARIMLQMTRTINSELLTGLGEEREGVEVRCVTCHRGTTHPETIERVVLASLDSEGIEAAAAKYRELREEYYGGHSYDFGEGPLNSLAEQVGLGGRLDEAVGLLELNIDFNPESSWAYSLLGEAHTRRGDQAAAKSAWEKALEIEPENRFARQKLEELNAAEEGGGEDGGSGDG